MRRGQPHYRDYRAPLVQTDQLDRECLLWCSTLANDEQACREVCLSSSPQNKSLFRQAMLQAEEDGLNEEHQHIFAAGAVWASVKLRRQG